MALTHSFACPLPAGLHARPASALEELARTFASEVSLVNQRTGSVANAKSVLSMLGADIRFEDNCILNVSGRDEAAAFAKLTAFIADTLPHCDDALPKAVIAEGTRPLPPGLRNAGANFNRGIIVVPGIALGRAVRAGGFKIPSTIPLNTTTGHETELQRLDSALEKLLAEYESRISSTGGVEGELLKAHRSMARDVQFHRVLHEALARGRTAAGAISDAEAHFRALLAASASPLVRERILDVQDVCRAVLRQIYGDTAVPKDITLSHDAVVLAGSLTPGHFLALDRRFLKGLVLAEAGTTSHTIILARSFGIPTLIGVADLPPGLDGDEVVLDADLGALVTNLTPAVRRYYGLELRRVAQGRQRLEQFAARPATMRDGRQIELLANILSSDEVGPAIAAGSQGIGLFRTEMLFLDRQVAPSEDEQYEEYRRALQAAGQALVSIRTLDIGGDKPLAYLNLPREENPFLGYRGVRLYPEFEALFRSQVRALVRASAEGRLKVLLPMIATVEEVRWARKIIREEQDRCAAEGLAFDRAMQVGAMLEVPAAAFSLEALSAEVDFFSVGSNDLLQYFMAADRGNPRVATFYNSLQPAFLRFFEQVVEEAHVHGKKVTLCGEMGNEMRCLPLLAGLGLDGISVASTAILPLKAELAGLTSADCKELLEKAVACATVSEVEKLLCEFSARRGAPLFGCDLIMLEVEAASKEEVIKQAIDQLYVAGRTEHPLDVEEAVWQREATYSTGFGNGFAIPHCKSNALRANSLVLLKLRQPVEWGSLDGLPVKLVILLAIRETDAATEHMKVLARLARLLMHEDFRARLEQEDEPSALCEFLQEKLQT